MGTEFLANVGTASSAHDMDVVRAALGENQINYLGFSYGTELGAAYAERYPDRVRAMVLDGAVDPSASTRSPTPSAKWRVSKRLSTTTPPTARQSAGCPLGTDPAKFVERFHQLVDPLVTNPAATDRSAWPELSGRDDRHRQRAVHAALLAVPHQRAAGPAARHRSGDLLLLADDYQHRDDSGHYKNLQDAFAAIRCVDSPYPTDPAAWADADRQIREAAPFMAYGDFTGFAPRDVCAMWPVPPTSTPASSHLAWPGQSGRRLNHARPRHPVRGGRGSGPPDGCRADHLRRHATHRGVQRRSVCRHRGGELPHRPGDATSKLAVLVAFDGAVINAAPA